MPKRKKKNKISLIPDEPVSIDGKLGFNKYADVISSCARGTRGPFTIGIFGSWGVGKTSLMRIIEKDLKDEKDIIVVWFNAWQYENEEHIIIPFLATIIEELKKNKNKIKKGYEKIEQTLRSIIYGVSFNFGVMKSDSGKMVEKEKELAEKIFSKQSLYYSAFKDLKKSIPENKKIVVIIDDLDRCNPEKSIKLLETIKLVLNQEGFIFILGIAQEMLDDYLEKIYREEYGVKKDHFDGQNYLDKIVQLPFSIPSHKDKINNFIKHLIKKLENISLKNELLNIAELIQKICNDNPRNAIRLINSLIIARAITKIKVEIKYFAISIALNQNPRTRDIIKTIEDEKLHKFLLAKILEIEKEQGKITEFWKKDIELKINKNERKIKKMNLSKGEMEEKENKTRKIILEEKVIKDLLSLKEGRAWLENDSKREAANRFAKTQEKTEEEIEIEEKKQQEQEKQFTEAIKKDPTNARNYYDYAIYLKEVKKDYNRANNLYDTAVALSPKNDQLLNSYAIFLEEIKNYKKSEIYYLKSLGIKFNNANTLCNYAVFLQQIKKDYDKAEEYYKRAMKIKSNDPSWQTNYATHIGHYATFLYKIKKDYKQAEKYYKRSLKIEPNKAINLARYAIFLDRIKKDYKQAIKFYENALKEFNKFNLATDYDNIQKIKKYLERVKKKQKENKSSLKK